MVLSFSDSDLGAFAAGYERMHRVGLQPGDGVKPVSYTHLRAHETVLDLVCRLLLEKKKQKLEQLGRS